MAKAVGSYGTGPGTGNTRRRRIGAMRFVSIVLAILTFSLVTSQLELEKNPAAPGIKINFNGYEQDLFLAANITLGILSSIGLALLLVFPGIEQRYKGIKTLDYSFHLLGGILLIGSGIMYAKWVYNIDERCSQLTGSLGSFIKSLIDFCTTGAKVKRAIALTSAGLNVGFYFAIGFLILMS